MRVECQKLRQKLRGFCDFCIFGATLCGNPAVECQKLRVFCKFWCARCTSLRENKGQVSKTEGFLRYWCVQKCLENCAHNSFCLIRPFFLRNKRKSPKNVKNWGFWRFFRVRSNPLQESGCRVSKTGFFLRFWCARICAYNLFCLIRPSPNPVTR